MRSAWLRIVSTLLLAILGLSAGCAASRPVGSEVDLHERNQTGIYSQVRDI